MTKSIELLVDQVRLSAKRIMRDFYELELLQSSRNAGMRFVDSAREKLAERYDQNLSKYYPRLVFNRAELDEIREGEEFIAIKVIDGLDSFARALPFFGSTMAKIIKKRSGYIVEMAVMVMPANNEIYYSVAGRGAWKERLDGSHTGAFRLRVANRQDVSHGLMVGSSSMHFDTASRISTNLQLLGSDAVLCSFFVCGKLDVVVLGADELMDFALSLFLRETGASYFKHQQLQIATNPGLEVQVRRLVLSNN